MKQNLTMYFEITSERIHIIQHYFISNALGFLFFKAHHVYYVI